MAAEDSNNGAWCGDTEDCSSTFIAFSFCESAKLKAGRPRKYKGSWFSSLC